MCKKKILIVENERIIAEDLKRILSSYEYDVINIATTGMDAINIAQKMKPDLILMDIILEGNIDGVHAAEQIKEKCDIPVVYLTAYADEKTLEIAKVSGPHGYLIKPFVEKELYATIEMAFYKDQTEKSHRRFYQKIENLHAVARDLVSCESNKDVYEMTIKTAESILDFSICNLSIVENDRLVVKATSTRTPTLTGASHPLDLNDSIAGKTFKTGKTILNLNLEKVLKADANKDDYKSIISAPVGNIGVFQVVSTIKDAFNMNDVHLLELLLGHTTEALKRINLQSRLKNQAMQDQLTGVYNRHYLYQTLDREVKLSKRYNRSIAFLIIDVNGLKTINDKYGHLTGDKVLQRVSSVITAEARETDIVVRYGGDEFLIMLPNTGKDVKIVEKRILNGIKLQNKGKKQFEFPISFAIGSAFWDSKSSVEIADVLAEADKKMYENKKKQGIQVRNNNRKVYE